MRLEALAPMDNAEFDALEDILDHLRQRDEEVPQWEFCEGAMAALQCTRRRVADDEALAVVVGVGRSEADLAFADAAQEAAFMALWSRRWDEVAVALAANIQTLEDARAYHPEVMDVRGAVAMLPEQERAEMAGQVLPAFGQVWALGFMFVVENWDEEWVPPKDTETAGWIDEALDAIVALIEDDTAKPEFNLHAQEGPPSTSGARVNAFGAAIWAVYDLHQIWHSLGPRTNPVHKAAAPGRNDPCPCGSGKKYKKCHGA